MISPEDVAEAVAVLTDAGAAIIAILPNGEDVRTVSIIPPDACLAVEAVAMVVVDELRHLRDAQDESGELN